MVSARNIASINQNNLSPPSPFTQQYHCHSLFSDECTFFFCPQLCLTVKQCECGSSMPVFPRASSAIMLLLPWQGRNKTQMWGGAASQERLTLYRWENSISKGVRRDRGNGFTVTEMTLEFRTVLFLGREVRRCALMATGGNCWIPLRPFAKRRVPLHSSVVVQALVNTVQKELAPLL